MKRPFVFAALLTSLTHTATAAEFIQPPDHQNLDGTVSRALVQQSDNFINMKYPYEGNTHLNLVVMKTASPKWIDSVSPGSIKFLADRGQVYCDKVDVCLMSYRIDNGPVKTLKFTNQAEDGSTNTAYVINPLTLASQLKGKKKLVVEIPLFKEGSQQFTFDLQNLQPSFAKLK